MYKEGQLTCDMKCSRRSQQASANMPTIMSLLRSLRLKVQMLTMVSKGRHRMRGSRFSAGCASNAASGSSKRMPPIGPVRPMVAKNTSFISPCAVCASLSALDRSAYE